MPRIETFNREEVLAKVRNLFWDKGFNGTSMQDLVDVTGLNRSSIYNSFGNKMTLYKTVLIQYQEEIHLFFDDALERGANPKEVIALVFENFIGQILKDVDGKGCFSINCKAELSRHNEGIRNYLEQMQQNDIDFFSNLIQQGQEVQIINMDNSPVKYAEFLFSSFQGLRMTGVLTRNRETLEQIVQNTLKVLD